MYITDLMLGEFLKSMGNCLRECKKEEKMNYLTLDEVKTELDILIQFDNFCKNEGLYYTLSGGTLLGAIRHKGFIPSTIANMAKMVCEKFGDGKINVVLDIPESNTFGYASDTKMKLNSDKLKKLGWKPEVDLEESYRRMILSMKIASD